MILLTIKLILICSLLVLGVTIATQESMLLYWFRVWAEKRESKIWKVFGICVWCSPSLFSIISICFGYALGLINFFDYRLIFLYVLTVCGGSIVSGCTWSVYLLIAEKTAYYANKNSILNELDNDNDT